MKNMAIWILKCKWIWSTKMHAHIFQVMDINLNSLVERRVWALIIAYWLASTNSKEFLNPNSKHALKHLHLL